MAVADVVEALLQLRPLLPALVPESDWVALQPEVTRLFAALEGAPGAAEQWQAVEGLARLLAAHPALREPLRDALTAGSGTRGGEAAPSPPAAGPPVPVPPSPPGPGPGSGAPLPTPRPGRGARPTPGPRPGVLQRWPHVDLDRTEPVPAGSDLRASVYVDTAGFRDSETGAAVDLPDLPEVVLQVVLVTSPSLAVRGAGSGRISIRRGEDRSTAALFDLRVDEHAEGVGVVTAFLAHEGRPAGSVQREVRIAGGAQGPARALLRAASSPSPDPARPPPDPSPLRVDLAARVPDLTVSIAAVPGTGRQRYACTVSTPHLPEYAGGATTPWDLPDGTTTRELVLGRMAGFTRAGVTGQARRAALVGAGLDLFDAAPEAFREVYWALRDARLPLGSVYVVSSEPFVPWELMVPSRAGQQDTVPIGVSSAVGRWVDEAHRSPYRQRLELETSRVLAPSYRGTRQLRFAAQEAEYVSATVPGRLITPATIAQIEAVLGEGGASLLHLVCHGRDTAAGEQVLELDTDEALSDGMLRGLPNLSAAVREAKPLVFLNACEVGRQTPALVGTGGFAARFIALDASAVVAPIWSVRDEVAAQVARSFYAAVRARPARPFASVVADIRRRAYEGPDAEDSWAAYCFFGDPLAAAGT